MRVAVIQIGMPIQSYTRDLVNGLMDQGCSVDLLIQNDDPLEFVDCGSVRARVEEIRLSRRHELLSRIRTKIARITGLAFAINSCGIHQAAIRFFSARPRHDFLIGIEKAGLEIAARHGLASKIPYIYYSLELYLEGHPIANQFRWQRKHEIRSHRSAVATIIQDRHRWNCLQEANHPDSNRVFYLPVGVRDDPAPASGAGSSEYAHPARQKLLYLGMLRRSRFVQALIDAVPALPADMELHLHGPLAAEEAKHLPANPQPGRLRITTDMLKESELFALVAQAGIGLALYRRDYPNDRHTAYSSQKIALYLRAGVPIIAFRSETYEDLFQRYRCGEMIDTMDDLPEAISRIRSSHSEYCCAARRAFEDIYNLDNYWKSLVEFLQDSASAGKASSTRFDRPSEMQSR